MILEGRPLTKKINEEILKMTAAMRRKPKLVTVSVDPDESTISYIGSQKKSAERLGIEYDHRLFNGISTGTLLSEIENLNLDENIDGILLSHPLPDSIDELKVLETLNPSKDVEGRTPSNIGLIVYDRPFFYPCTAQAVIEILDFYSISTEGKKVVVVGRSSTVGKPLSLMLLQRKNNSTPTICHTGTSDIKKEIREAEILVVAAGKYGIVKTEDISQGTVVIDVGINFVDGKLKGDVMRNEKEEEFKKISITPVPGGVGPVTTAILMRNVVKNSI